MVRIYKEWLKLAVITIIFIEPKLFRSVEIFSFPVFHGLRFLMLLIVLSEFFLSKREKSATGLLIFVSFGYVALVTAINGGDIVSLVGDILGTFGWIMLFSLYYDSEFFVSSQMFAYSLLIHANLLSILIFPNGISSYKSYFLGYYNMMGSILFPGLVFSLLYSYLYRKYLYTVAMIISIIAQSLLVWSGDLLVMTAACLVVFLFLKGCTRIFNFINYFLLQLGFFIPVDSLSELRTV